MRKSELTIIPVATSKDARQAQRRIALNHIRLRSAISRAELARVSGLQRSAVSVIVDELIEEGWVTEGAANGPAHNGKPPLLHLDVERAGIVAVELRPEVTTVALAAVDARYVEQTSWPTPQTPEASCAGWRAPLPLCGERILASCVRGWVSACRGGSIATGAWSLRPTCAGATSISHP